MPSTKAWVFDRERHGRGGHRCLCAGSGDHRRVAAVQHRGADLLSLQPADSQAGTGALHSQPDVLQLVAERVQHATHPDRTRHRGPPRWPRALSGGGFPRHFPHHECHVEHGGSQHRQVAGGGLPTQLPLQDAAPGRSDGSLLHVDALAVLLRGRLLAALGRLPSALRVVHPVQREGARSRDTVLHLHLGFALPHLPSDSGRAVRHLPQSAQSCTVPL